MRLNRAVAVAKVCGPAAGIAAVEAIPGLRQLGGYYLLHAVLGELELRRSNIPAARARFLRALELTRHSAERNFLSRQIEACTDSTSRETAA